MDQQVCYYYLLMNLLIGHQSAGSLHMEVPHLTWSKDHRRSYDINMKCMILNADEASGETSISSPHNQSIVLTWPLTFDRSNLFRLCQSLKILPEVARWTRRCVAESCCESALSFRFAGEKTWRHQGWSSAEYHFKVYRRLGCIKRLTCQRLEIRRLQSRSGFSQI